MARSGLGAEQIVSKLKQMEVLLAQGKLRHWRARTLGYRSSVTIAGVRSTAAFVIASSRVLI